MIRRILEIYFIFLLIPLIAEGEILHLEIGAANYSASDGNSPYRFRILDDTLEKLIAEYGEKGTIYLNDIDESGLALAASHLNDWLRARNYTDIQILQVKGDFLKVEFSKVKTAHMKNPDYRQLPFGESEDPDSAINKKLFQRLEDISELSETGLVITTDYDWFMDRNWKLTRSYLLRTGRTGFGYYPSNFEPGNSFMVGPREYLIRSKTLACSQMFL
jgi:hypothetical protein